MVNFYHTFRVRIHRNNETTAVTQILYPLPVCCIETKSGGCITQQWESQLDKVDSNLMSFREVPRVIANRALGRSTLVVRKDTEYATGFGCKHRYMSWSRIVAHMTLWSCKMLLSLLPVDCASQSEQIIEFRTQANAGTSVAPTAAVSRSTRSIRACSFVARAKHFCSLHCIPPCCQKRGLCEATCWILCGAHNAWVAGLRRSVACRTRREDCSQSGVSIFAGSQVPP